MSNQSKKKKLLKTALIIGGIILVAGIAAAYYIFNVKFDDTRNVKADYTVNAAALIDEFKKDDPGANKKYAEKIIVVNGRVTETEAADTTMNLKMTAADGSYLIFAFQQNEMATVKQIKAGDSISVKGSCSGGTYSSILETEYISFKRCSINNKY